MKEKVKEIFEQLIKEKNYNLSDEDIEVYISMYKSINELTNNKLNYKDIIYTYDDLTTLMQVLHSKVRIKVPYYALKNTFGNILTKEEMEYFVFTMWYGECVTVHDELSNRMVHGVAQLTSPEEIKRLKDYYYNEDNVHYDMFHFEKKEDSNTSDKFGYSETNPIKTTSIPNAYAYLNRLKTIDGEKIVYARVGSLSIDGIDASIDKYVIGTQKLGEDPKILGTIYINSYCDEDSEEAPEGLILE